MNRRLFALAVRKEVLYIKDVSVLPNGRIQCRKVCRK